MRISIDPQDRAFGRTPAGLKAVTVDGVAYPFCITADEEEGYVLAYRTNALEGGRMGLVPDEGRPGHWQTIEVRGKVALEWQAGRWDTGRQATAEDYGRVKVGRDANGDLVVRVMSVVRPGAGRQMRKEAATLPSTDAAICQLAGLLAGAAAEDMCARFGDTLDPSECARAAVDAARRMVAGGPQEG